jgi:hypothetical protein
VRCIDSPPLRLRRSPPRGRRQRTGEAGSAASAGRFASLAGLALLVAACSMPRLPGMSPSSAASSRAWDDYKVQVGRRLVAANPNGTYTGAVPEPLLAIPVLEVELNGDGSVRRVHVQRHPSQASDTVQLAVNAVHRAAPFGDVSHLPKPWRFSEAFLFRDDRRFKPRSLDQ